MKVAVTVLAAVMLIVQGPLRLEQAPLQPPNTEPLTGLAVRVTLPLNWALQVAPHSIPTGLLVTIPFPAPARVTIRR